MKKKLSAIILIFALTILPLLTSACADNPAAVAADTTVAEKTTQSATEGESYAFPAVDYDGADFKILNTTTEWNFYIALDHESMTGEILDDAVYTRNRLIEDKFNLKIKIIDETIDNVYGKIRTSVQAGEQAYDAIFCPGWINDSNNIGSMALEHMFYDLTDIPEINLKETWWNQALIKEGSIGTDGALYFAANDISISTLQSTWCLFFNENMFEDLKLDRPYELVKSGKWTLDKFAELIKAGTRLGGDESFKWNAEGNSVYGYTSYEGGTLALVLGSGERFIDKDKDGNPFLAIETQRFFDLSGKIASILGIEGEYVNANDASQSGFHFEDIFMKGRALFTAAEFKAATRFRVMEDAYGIVPMPKLEETQKDYYSAKTRQAYVCVIPVTNQEPNKTGSVLDALSYISYRDVTPVLYNVTISQKGLRNEESIEMLELIRNTQYYDAGVIYGWTSALNNALISALDKGNGDIVSILDKNRDKVNTKIQETLEELYK
ncbi:MAG: hypothetical protein AB9835_01110 [Eubacteriales bacterium]